MHKAWVALMGVVAVGCGAPASLPPPVVPTVPNSPPRIVNTNPRPVRSTFFNSNACAQLNPEFSIQVEERDLGDVLFNRWFIDGTNTEPFITLTSPPGGSAMRTLSAPSSTAFKATLANLPAGSTHLLTVYASDTEFNEGSEVSVIPRPLIDGGVDQGYFDSFTWALDVESCP